MKRIGLFSLLVFAANFAYADSCTVKSNTLSTVENYYAANKSKRSYRDPTRGCNWYNVLLAFGENLRDNACSDHTPMTAADAQNRVKNWRGWQPIATELKRLEDCRVVTVDPPDPQPLRAEPQQDQTLKVFKYFTVQKYSRYIPPDDNVWDEGGSKRHWWYTFDIEVRTTNTTVNGHPNDKGYKKDVKVCIRDDIDARVEFAMETNDDGHLCTPMHLAFGPHGTTSMIGGHASVRMRMIDNNIVEGD